VDNPNTAAPSCRAVPSCRAAPPAGASNSNAAAVPSSDPANTHACVWAEPASAPAAAPVLRICIRARQCDGAADHRGSGKTEDHLVHHWISPFFGSRLLNEFGAKTVELFLRYRPRFVETIELVDFVGDTEADYTPQLVTRLLRLLATPLSHASGLSNQIREYAKIGKYDQHDYPDRLDPAGDVMTPKQIAKYRYEQPKPDNEDEYCKDVC
jgi:hypothetical protein